MEKELQEALCDFFVKDTQRCKQWLDRSPKEYWKEYMLRRMVKEGHEVQATIGRCILLKHFSNRLGAGFLIDTVDQEKDEEIRTKARRLILDKHGPEKIKTSRLLSFLLQETENPSSGNRYMVVIMENLQHRKWCMEDGMILFQAYRNLQKQDRTEQVRMLEEAIMRLPYRSGVARAIEEVWISFSIDTVEICYRWLLPYWGAAHLLSAIQMLSRSFQDDVVAAVWKHMPLEHLVLFFGDQSGKHTALAEHVLHEQPSLLSMEQKILLLRRTHSKDAQDALIAYLDSEEGNSTLDWEHIVDLSTVASPLEQITTIVKKACERVTASAWMENNFLKFKQLPDRGLRKMPLRMTALKTIIKFADRYQLLSFYQAISCDESEYEMIVERLRVLYANVVDEELLQLKNDAAKFASGKMYQFLMEVFPQVWSLEELALLEFHSNSIVKKQATTLIRIHFPDEVNNMAPSATYCEHKLDQMFHKKT